MNAVCPRPSALPGFASLGDLLRHRAREQADERAYIFLSNRGGEEAVLTFGELARRAEALALRLAARVAVGERALLVVPSGLDFIVSYFACLIAGVIVVPIMPPRRNNVRDASSAIIADCAPRLALTSADLVNGVRADLTERFELAGLPWLDITASTDGAADPCTALPSRNRCDIAFLQYTSGSTSAPKGVMVSHGNLLDNLEMIRIACGNDHNSTYVSWVPLYHDMGLILNVLESLYVGALCVLMAPVTFMHRPLAWLRTIARYRAQVAGAPNFAYDLCVDRFRPEDMQGVDLGCWELAFNAAEPVSAKTIERFAATFGPYGFAAKASYPCYGMAEATLLTSGGRRGAGFVSRSVSREALQQRRMAPPASAGDAQRLVGCGRALQWAHLAIVDPVSGYRCGPDRIGELWVSGPHIAQGYWRRVRESAATFQARIEGEDDRPWLRTGDLGWLDGEGELYIAGRIKDVIIIRGRNHYPQDIEATVSSCHPALRRHCCAAFGLLNERGEERLAVVQEIERTHRHKAEAGAIRRAIREAVALEHEIMVHEIALVATGWIPKTTSGKIQRNLTREFWRQGTLELWEETPDMLDRECQDRAAESPP